MVGRRPMKMKNDEITRPNAVEVDLDAITHNVEALRQEVGAATKIYGAVKANAYGFGLPSVAEAIIAGGADGFGLSDPEDALRIRGAGIDAPILLYGGMLPSPETAAFVRRWGLIFPSATSILPSRCRVQRSDPRRLSSRLTWNSNALGWA